MNESGNADIESLIADLNCDDSMKCRIARGALVAVGEEALVPLVKALHSKKRWVRWEAAKALGQIGGPTATQVLVDALRDRMFEIRWLAAEGLIAIGRPALVPLLEALIKNSDAAWMRQGAHHVLHDMDRGELNEVLKPVLTALEGMNPALGVPLAARAALEEIKRAEGLPAKPTS